MTQSATAVRPGGRIHMIGALTGWAGDVPTHLFLLKQIRVQGLLVGSRRMQNELVRAIDANGLKPVLDRTFPLAELKAAFEHELGGKHFGKIGVEI